MLATFMKVAKQQVKVHLLVAMCDLSGFNNTIWYSH